MKKALVLLLIAVFVFAIAGTAVAATSSALVYPYPYPHPQPVIPKICPSDICPPLRDMPVVYPPYHWYHCPPDMMCIM